MEKKNKTITDNQWTSLPLESFKEANNCVKKEKTATDNQWTSTCKMNAGEDQ
jgi:hypothetical protein